MGQFDFKYDATAEEAVAQVQAYLNHVGKRILEVNEKESQVLNEVHKLEFILELPDIEENIMKEIGKIDDKIRQDFLLGNPDVLNADELKQAFGILKSLLGKAMDCILDGLQAIRLLKWASENNDLQTPLKLEMLEECERFHLNYWQLTENEHG